MKIATTFRKFENEFDTIQRITLNNWLDYFGPKEIYAYGPNTCSDYNIQWITDVDCTETSAIYINDLFQDLDDITIVLSSDILINTRIFNIKEIVKLQEYCIVGNQFEYNWKDDITYDKFKNENVKGDYFIFTKKYFDNLPKAPYGRGTIDCFIFKLATNKGSLIDGTHYLNFKHCMHDNHIWEQLQIHPHEHPEVQLAEQECCTILGKMEIHEGSFQKTNYIINSEGVLKSR